MMLLKKIKKFVKEVVHLVTGFCKPLKIADEMLDIINYSKHIYYDRKRQWNQMIDRGMANDFSWNASKFRYEGLYNYLIGE